MKNKAIQELQALQAKHNGFLRPKVVVDHARSPKSELHRYFDWDDSSAAEKYRLEQARGLIRVVVSMNVDVQKEVRVFVSLTTDRHEEGGYRELSNVIDDDDLRRILLRDALQELRTLQNKYRTLTELASVFKAIDKINASDLDSKLKEVKRKKG